MCLISFLVNNFFRLIFFCILFDSHYLTESNLPGYYSQSNMVWLCKPDSEIMFLCFWKKMFRIHLQTVAYLCIWQLSRPNVVSTFQVPMEYNHLQEIPIIALRNRLLLLHHISELFCPCIPMFDLEGSLDETGLGPSVGFDTLRGILISQGKVL